MSFRKEQWIAGGFGLAAAGVAAGLLVLRYGDSPRRLRRGPTIDRWAEHSERTLEVATWLINGSLILAGALLLLSLTIAFGIGPNGMAKTVDHVRVEERVLLYPDGHAVYNEQPMEGERIRCYLRVRLPEGFVTELAFSPEVYRTARIGQVGSAKMIGRRLVSFTGSA